MSTCSFDLQKNIVGSLLRSSAQNIKEVNQEIKKFDANLDIHQALEIFDEKYKASLNRILSVRNIDISKNPSKSGQKASTIKRIHNIVSNFQSAEVTDLFHQMHVAKQFFQQETSRMVLNAVLIGDSEVKTYVKNNNEVNDNIKALKNNLFETIVRYLDSKGLLKSNRDQYFNSKGEFIGKLYSNGKLTNYKLYKRTIDLLDVEFFKNSTEKSLLGKNLPTLSPNLMQYSSRVKLEAYNAAVFLVNFDNVISKYFSNIVSINYSQFNEFDENKEKYQLKSKGFETPYWLEDDHSSEGVENIEDDLTKNVVALIPIYNKDNELQARYMETKDLYAFAALIRSFELQNFNTFSKKEEWSTFSTNPKKMLNWYLDQIIKAHESGYSKVDNFDTFSIFKYKVDIARSLKNFIETIAIKEENSSKSIINVLSQVLNNSNGAIYSIYNANTKKYETVEMFSHNSNRVAYQNTIYAHLSLHVDNEDRFEYTLEELQAAVKTPKSLSKHINRVLGIFLPEDGAVKLLEFFKSKNEKNPEEALKNITNKISQVNSDENGQITRSLLERIKHNETLRQNIETYSETESPSEIIADLLNNAEVMQVLDIALDSIIQKPIMNISTQSGEKIPTYKLANLTYNDAELLSEYKKSEGLEGSSFRSLFTSTDSPILVGTSTKLELRNQDVNKSAAKFSVMESLEASLKYDFLSALDQVSASGNPVGINVMLGNYSDKSTILSKIINLDAKYGEKFIIGSKDSKEIMKSEEIIELVRTQGFSFYSDIFNKEIFPQYEIIFKHLGKGNLPLDFDDKVTVINEFLKNTSKDDLLELQKTIWISNKKFGLTEETHYSSYADGLALNMHLVNHYRVFSSSKNFEIFVESQEKSFIDKYKKYNKSNIIFDINHKEKTYNGDSEKYVELENQRKFLGIDSQITKTIDTQGTNVLNPIVKKWLWVNALFRNEYLYISTKGEFNHPHKIKGFKIHSQNVTKDSNGIYKVKQQVGGKEVNVGLGNSLNFRLEMSGRLSSMAKRNVAFTATIEKPVRKSRFGVSDKVNVAIIQDLTAQLYNIDGDTKDRQDIHDGSSFINYLHSRMIENSYPGKGYTGTKKQFATFVTKYGSAVKKDAETVITNDKMRNSRNSKVNLKNIHRKMLSSHNINISNYGQDIPSERTVILFRKGSFHKLTRFEIKNNQIRLKLSEFTGDGKWSNSNFTEFQPIKNLYDIWEVFGAEYTYDENFNFSEGSNDLLYDLVTGYSSDGEYILKDNMIHVLSNHSSFKSGATRLNPKSSWTDSSQLMFTSFDNSHMGPQLDANHDSDGSEVREVSQVISALAQNTTTSHLAEEAYKNLGQIIKSAAEKYSSNIGSDKLYRKISKDFFNSVVQSENVSLAKSILETFGKNDLIPFSNQNMFQLFVREIITKMNNEFITRYYSGIGAVLNPSHNIIQVYEDENGNVYTQADVTKYALDQYVSNPNRDKNLSVDQIVENYITEKFKPELIPIERLNPGETVIISDTITYTLENSITGEPVEVTEEIKIPKTLDKIEDYYEFKKQNAGQTVTLARNIPRDLKPSEITFKVKVELPIINESDKIIYGHPGIGKSYLYNQNKSIIDFDEVYKPEINKFIAKSLNLKVSDLTKDIRNEFKKSDFRYIEFMDQLWEKAKLDASQSNKKLFASDLIILDRHSSDFDKFLNLNKEKFIERAAQRGELNEFTEIWKDNIDSLLKSVNSKKIINIDTYLSDILSNNLTYSTTRNVNLFDTDSVRLRYKLNQLESFYKSIKSKGFSDLDTSNQMNEFIQSDEDYIILENFAKHWKVGYLEFEKVNNLLNAWTQRNLQLLDLGKIMTKVSPLTNFSDYFGDDNIIKDIFEDVENHYLANNSIEIFDYKFKPAELILPNLYKSNFDTGNDSISTINSEKSGYFKKKLDKYYEEDTSNNDMKIVLGENNFVYVKFVSGNNLKGISNVPTVEDVDLDTGTFETYRVDRFGKKLYQIPKHAIVKVENGHDVVYIQASYYNNKLKKSMVVNNFSDSVKFFIRSFSDNIRAIVPLMNGQIETFYKDENTVYDVNRTTFNIFAKHLGFWINPENETFDNTWFNKNKEVLLNRSANKMFASWQKSHEFVSARIPAQSMQSFMEMKNIGYLNTTSNDAYVSLWQIWLQGSDFDIDKSYMMGYGFNRNSQMDTWGNISDYSSKEQLDELEKLPLPTGKEITYSTDGANILPELLDIFKLYQNNLPEELSVEGIKLINKILRKIGEKSEVSLSEELQATYSSILKKINTYNSSRSHLSSRHGVKNSIVARIKNIISSPSNQILANKPVDMDELHDAASVALSNKQKRNPKIIEEPLSSWDMFSMFKQQRDAAVGKEDVGIGANGLKVFFNLTNYYNSWFNTWRNSGTANYLTNNYSFNKTFIIDGQVRRIRTLADIKLSNQQITDLNQFYNDQSTNPIYSNAALFLSSFVSAATDNAKELIMAKINAIPDLAYIHVYMLSLGFTVHEVANYMNSDLVDYIIENLEKNNFETTDEGFIPMLIKDYQELSNASDEEINTFKNFYYGGQEFKRLASILKVNQKTSANILELNKFLSNLEDAMHFRENVIFGKDLHKVQDLDNIDWIVETLIEKNDNLFDTEHVRTHIKEVLTRANNITVVDDSGKLKQVSILGGQFDFRYYINSNPQNDDYRKAVVDYYNLIKSTFNIFHVIQESNHFKAMIDGLATSHNILMSTSRKYKFIFSDLRDIVKKRSKDVYTANKEEGKSKIKTKLGNPALGIAIDDTVINRTLVYFDKTLISKWAEQPREKQTGSHPSDINLNVQQLLKLAGVESVRLYTDDSARRDPSRAVGEESAKTVYVTDKTPFFVSLNTSTGFANFKVLMEKVLFKILENEDSPVTKSLRVMSIRNAYGLIGPQIVPSFPISQLNSPVNADKFQELLNEFNTIDSKTKTKIKNINGVPLKWKDLFWVYNIIVNNESYGDRRLTPIFEDYVKEKDSLGNDYIKFGVLVDKGDINLFDIDQEYARLVTDNMKKEDQDALREELITKQENDIIFHGYHKGGKLKVKSPNIQLNKRGGYTEIILANADYVMNASMDITSSKDKKIYSDVKSFIDILRSGNIIVTFNCN